MILHVFHTFTFLPGTLRRRVQAIMQDPSARRPDAGSLLVIDSLFVIFLLFAISAVRIASPFTVLLMMQKLCLLVRRAVVRAYGFVVLLVRRSTCYHFWFVFGCYSSSSAQFFASAAKPASLLHGFALRILITRLESCPWHFSSSLPKYTAWSRGISSNQLSTCHLTHIGEWHWRLCRLSSVSR